MAAAFVVCGWYGFASGISRRVTGNGPFNSIDVLLSEALHVNQPAEKISAALSNLKGDGPVAILVPQDGVYDNLVLPEISTISWPRQFYLIHCRDGDVRNELLALRARHFAGALVYNLHPPILPSNVCRIGRLTAVPIAQ
jgi:hypothetical protein